MRDSSWHRREKFVDGRHGERGQSLFLSHIIRSENEENNGESLPLIIVLGVARVEKKATMMNIRMREREREREREKDLACGNEKKTVWEARGRCDSWRRGLENEVAKIRERERERTESPQITMQKFSSCGGKRGKLRIARCATVWEKVVKVSNYRSSVS